MAAQLFSYKRGKSSRLPKDEITEFPSKTEQKKCNNTPKIYLDGLHRLFEDLNLNPLDKQSKRFEVSLRIPGKVVKNLEIPVFSIKNNIIEFGIHMMRRIIHILEDFSHLCR